MKKADREIYVVLTSEVYWQLCTFCRFAEFNGFCDAGYIECHHPLGYRLQSYDAELCPGEDCWGFRPNKEYSISLIADMVGIVLEKGWQAVTWWENEDGRLVIAGEGGDSGAQINSSGAKVKA